MKKIITMLLVLWLAVESKPLCAQGVNTPMCLTIAVLLAVGGATVVISCCRPTHRCISDPNDPDEPNKSWCSTMTRMAAKSSGYNVGPVNYKSLKKCMSICGTNSAPRGGYEVVIDPSYLVQRIIEDKWVTVGRLESNYNGDKLEFQEFFPEGTMPPIGFYRVVEVYEDPGKPVEIKRESNPIIRFKRWLLW